MKRLAILLLFLPMAANAIPITYQVNGTFDDGGSLFGLFEFDSTGPTFGPNLLTTTLGSTLNGTTYTGGRCGAGGPVISGEFALGRVCFTGLAGTQLQLRFVDALWTNNTSSLLFDSFEIDAAGTSRALVSGFAHAVPEPGTLSLLAFGLVVMGLTRRRLRIGR